jgi:hypothetical protein
MELKQSLTDKKLYIEARDRYIQFVDKDWIVINPLGIIRRYSNEEFLKLHDVYNLSKSTHEKISEESNKQLSYSNE